jgi:nitroreductase
MTPILKENILAQLQWRYATKKFDPTQKIPTEEWEVLEKSLILSPSSFGLEPWKFFVVTNPEIRTKLVGASWNQAQVVDASHLVVLTAKRDISLSDINALVERTAEIRNISPTLLEGFKSMLSGFIHNLSQATLDEWASRQVYIALGQFITTAALLGIDTSPMEGFHPEQVDELLGLKNSGYGAVLLCAAGYRQAGDKCADLAKVRRKREDVIVHI